MYMEHHYIRYYQYLPSDFQVQTRYLLIVSRKCSTSCILTCSCKVLDDNNDNGIYNNNDSTQ